MGQKNATQFLNVDLDIQVKSGLKELLEALGPAVTDLGRESEDFASVEVNTAKSLTIDETILAFYNIIQALPPRARAIWESAESRCFDIGIQGGDHPHQTRYLLSQESMARIASLKADIAITVYAPPKE